MDAKREMILSVGLAVAQAAAQLTDYVPDRHKPFLLLAHVALAELRKQRAFRFNPDGTPARAPYDAPTKRQVPPHQIGALALLCALLWPVSLSAQTRARPEQLGADPAPSSRVLVVLPSGTVALATLDGVTLDTSGPAPVLRAVVAAVRVRSLRWKPSGIEGAWTLPERPSAGTLQLYRNGLLLTEGDDYTVDSAGTRVTMLAGLEARAGDIVRAHYFY